MLLRTRSENPHVLSELHAQANALLHAQLFELSLAAERDNSFVFIDSYDSTPTLVPWNAATRVRRLSLQEFLDRHTDTNRRLNIPFYFRTPPDPATGAA